jgi:hypothetical protein
VSALSKWILHFVQNDKPRAILAAVSVKSLWAKESQRHWGFHRLGHAHGAGMRQKHRFIVYNYCAGSGCMTSPTIINKLYIFVNNQFIPDGIGIAKLKAGSALID